MLVQIPHPTLRPLIYPLVQTLLGTLQVQPSAKYHPLRIHLLRMLLQLSKSTDTLLPTATYILEVSQVKNIVWPHSILSVLCFRCWKLMGLSLVVVVVARRVLESLLISPCS